MSASERDLSATNAERDVSAYERDVTGLAHIALRARSGRDLGASERDLSASERDLSAT